MSYLKYNLPGLWFQIFREVLAANEKMDKDRLDKSMLREVTTSIFIASTQRGITRPYSYSKFQVALLELTKGLHRESEQKKVYNAVREILNKKEKTNGHINTG
jgi:hypothetical protein